MTRYQIAVPLAVAKDIAAELGDGAQAMRMKQSAELYPEAMAMTAIAGYEEPGMVLVTSTDALQAAKEDGWEASELPEDDPEADAFVEQFEAV
jgi:hypothetical protein